MMTEGPDDRATIGVYPELPLEFSFVGGRRLPGVPPQPLRFEVYRDGGASLPALFTPSIPLIRADLLEALRAAGVDNIDDYPALLHVPHTGQTSTEYRAANIVGTARIADLGKSVFDAPSGRTVIDVDFDRIATVDDPSTASFLMFRMAEAVSVIVAHDRVRRAVEPLGFPMLVFRPLTEVIA